MFIIRKIGKTLRGQAKPYQVVCAAILGALIGFAPPLANAPLYLIAVVLLLAILNANFFIATVTAGLCKLLALALMPVSFELGLVLVDGPLQSLMRSLINAPVTALMGFDYYITTGGTILALFLGTALGVAYVMLIQSFRRKMAKVESSSEKYANFVSKRGNRILMWVLFGGKAKLSYAELMEQKKIGNPVRPLGIAFAVLVVVLLFILQQFASGPLITALLRGQLESFNGATVDLKGIDLDLSNGKLTVEQLAMADPDNLELDLIRANQVVAQISTSDLLRKRITIDQIVIDDAVQGIKRDRPGVLIGRPPEPIEPTGDGKSLEDYFAQAKEWKARLETYYDWYKKLKGPPAEEEAKEETPQDRLRKWAQRYGHANVRAMHLIQGSPSVLVKEVTINKLRGTWPKEETLDIYATNLSTHPALAPDKPRVTVKSSAQSFDMDLSIAPQAMNDKESILKLTLRNQSIDEALKGLDLGSDLSLKGGTWQAGIDGAWSDVKGLDLPLTFVMRDTTLLLPGIEPTPVESLPIAFGVVGEIGAPQFKLDFKQLTDSLLQNGGKAVLNQYVGKATAEAQGKIKDAIGEELGGEVGSLIQGLLGGNKDKKQADENGEGTEEKQEPDLKDKLLDGLLNKKKKEQE